MYTRFSSIEDLARYAIILPEKSLQSLVTPQNNTYQILRDLDFFIFRYEQLLETSKRNDNPRLPTISADKQRFINLQKKMDDAGITIDYVIQLRDKLKEEILAVEDVVSKFMADTESELYMKYVDIYTTLASIFPASEQFVGEELPDGGDTDERQGNPGIEFQPE